MDKGLKSVLEYLKADRGLDFSGFRPAMLDRRVGKRREATGCLHYSEYLEYLREHDEEAGHLIDVLTINVSRFFRTSLTFEYLAARILPFLFKEKAGRRNAPLRVWSAGCAHGEEPYSIAILIKEIADRENIEAEVNIFATDIDEKAIQKARKAVYGFESIKDVKTALLKKYFLRDEEGYRLRGEVRDSVHFSVYDMAGEKTHSPPESIYGDFDMVLCRNLLIYFQPEKQGVVFEKLYHSLIPGGYLVLGEAETPLTGYQRGLQRVTDCCHIYRKLS